MWSKWSGLAWFGWVLGGWGWGRLADLPEFRFLLLRKEGIKVLACNYSQSLLCICNRFSFSIYLDLKCFIYVCMGLIQGGQTIFVSVVFELGGMNAPRQFDCGFYSL